MENEGISLLSTLTVLFYTILQNLTLVLPLLVLPIITFLVIKPKSSLLSSLGAWGISFVLGGILAFSAPYLTHSSLAFVLQPVDYAFLVLIGIGGMIYSRLVLHPLTRSKGY